jgi:bifunctional non-homologous end joining protein LigD
VKAQGLEGLVAKRLDSRYEPGLRSGAWMKMRVNRGQEFVIGGYTRGTKTFDALVGVHERKKLMNVARTRNGFTPATRAVLFKKFKGLEIPECPFTNLPEPKGGRWGQGLTKAKMAECVWLKPVLVGYFEFLEWVQPKVAAPFSCNRATETQGTAASRARPWPTAGCSQSRPVLVGGIAQSIPSCAKMMQSWDHFLDRAVVFTVVSVADVVRVPRVSACVDPSPTRPPRERTRSDRQ